MNILIAPNSFKECADSVEISELIKASLLKFLPAHVKKQIEFDLRPISDGGDGFLSVCQRAFGAETLHFEIPYPYSDEKFFCPIGFSPETKTLFIESAEVLGMKTIPIEFRKPMEISSKGMGELLLQIMESAESGILDLEKVVVGIGGTGTNDLGMGMMEVFGLEFYDSNDKRLEIAPKNFLSVEKIVVPEIQLPFKLELVVDVENSLLGREGANLLFAKQKGASDAEAEKLEKGFSKILYELEIDDKTKSGLNGAGGGLAAAFKLFFNANMKFAASFIRDELGINNYSRNYDLVITGEGKLDAQSLLNKGAMIVANEFAEKKNPLYFICGETDGILPEIDNWKVIELSEFFNSLEESVKNIEKGIDLACKRIVRDIIQLVAKNN